MRSSTGLWCLVLCLALPSAVVADDDDLNDAVEAGDPEPRQDVRAERASRRFDYSRYNNGPRNVPTPRGASAERANALGLGTRAAADRLLHRSLDPRWVAAAGDEMPEHLQWPVDLGRFGRGFGFVRRSRPELPHRGVDIVADEGSVIRAAGPGIVAYSDNEVRGYGNLVVIVHPNGWVSMYAHCVRTTVQPGWRVQAGERIGFVGTTGISRGPHLHFEVRRRGHAIDPMPHFEGRPWIAEYRRWRDLRASGRYQAPEGYLAATLPPDPRAPRATPRRSRAAAPTRARAADDASALADVRRILRSGPTASELALVEGDRFPTLLWPVRGGTRGSDYRQPRGVNVEGDQGAAVRAVADGLVVYVGEGLRGLGRAIAILHVDGKLSLYGSNSQTHVEVGQAVQRGEWIAKVGSSGGGEPHLHFQLREGDQVVDPTALFVGAPES